MAYVNWLLHCSTPISDFDLICRRLSSHTHGRLVNGEILIYRRRAAPFKFEASRPHRYWRSSASNGLLHGLAFGLARFILPCCNASCFKSSFMPSARTWVGVM